MTRREALAYPGYRSALIRGRKLGRHFEEPAWEWWSRAGDSVGWWVRPGWREQLLGPQGLRLDEWRAQGRLRVVKSGPHRVVYHVELPSGGVYIKHFLVPNRRAKWRQWFRRGKGRNEAKQAARLSAAGVPTITPIALGENRHRRFLYDNYLVTLEVPDAIPMDELIERVLPTLPRRERDSLRRRLAVELGALTARLHDGGFLHNDFHPGNLLVRRTASNQVQLVMIDLDALRGRDALGPAEVLTNLALLNHYFWIRASRSDRHRFLRSYVKHSRRPPSDLKSFAREVERHTRLWAERLWRRWGKRCLETNKYFAVYSEGRSWAVASRELSPETVRTLLRDPDAPLARPDAVRIKTSRTTTVAALPIEVGGEPTPVIYKRFNRKKLFDPIYTLFRPSRAWRAWRNGQHLASRGITTPQNLAVIGRSSLRKRIFPHQYCPHDTYLVTRKVEPAATLFEVVSKPLKELDPKARRAFIERLVPCLAALIRTLHERSLSHRDLKSANILIVGDPFAESPQLSLIDLVGVRIEYPISRHHQIQNLARLQLSLASVEGRTRTDALRFLRLYLPCGAVRRDAWKSVWREVETASRKKAARNYRNHRKLS